MTTSRSNRRPSWLHLTAALWLASGCGSPTPVDTEKTPKKPETVVTSYPLRGEVVRIDRTTGRVAIRHEEIPDFMPAMTMPFDLNGNEILEELQPGDRIEAVLRIGPQGSTLDDVIITELAAPESDPAQTGLPPVLEVGATVPDFLMRTQDNETLRLSELHGRVVVLTFIYTRCPLPDYCPLLDRKFADLARRLRAVPAAADATSLLSISFDPQNDQPDVLARHAEMVDARPPLWRFAVADHEELRKVAPALGLSYGPGRNEIIHTLSTAVIDPSGRLAALYRGNTWEVNDVFKKVRDVLAQTGGRDTPNGSSEKSANPYP